jgi:bifunctional aspartokinase / homoserine dehydrogenase 1
MRVLKFGGSSVADAERIRRAMDIVIRRREAFGSVVLVLSAMKGVTDALLEASFAAAKGDQRYQERFHEILKKTEMVREQLVPGDKEVFEETDRFLEELSDLLRGVMLVRECSPRTRDLILSFGERLNCRICAGYLTSIDISARYVDSRPLIRTDAAFGAARVEFGTSYGQLREALDGFDGVSVVTGFIGSTAEGVTTTIGRNGSDYTASLVGAALGAEAIEIWTDVDGVLSADPNMVSDAFVVPELSYSEAVELSYFGARVIHPSTMLPAIEKEIPLWIKNTLNEDAPGTRITKTGGGEKRTITGIASIEHVALINVEGGGMVGLPGIASRVFRALADAEVNIIMISQASSEHSICIVCDETSAPRALGSLETELSQELASRTIDQFELIGDLEIVAVIGANMRGTPGISGRLFSALGEAGVNVLAIAQGSSEMNISFVVQGRDRALALNTVHRAFFAPEDKG